ncbi:ATP-binding protein [Natronoflexus pectinivorans]|uniref:histidine kinase n=1 Tax=Natronoflexus pectinivorans TaxID=682526 RepID=A0A4R2GD98_9BACT|nr:ATP-binding protein [Natronoflexus pectinivorans]TCO06006.1 PAS domain S-box-containing protein [Natronoflexus pectinivorans]
MGISIHIYDSVVSVFNYPLFNFEMLSGVLFLDDTMAAESLNQLKQSISIALIVLGVAMAVFLIINFRNNMKRRKTPSGISSAPLMEPSGQFNQLNFSILDHHPTPTAICRNDGIIEYVNQNFSRAFGSTPTNMIRLLLFNILPGHISTALSYTLEENKSTSGETSSGFFSPNTKTRYKVRWQLSDAKKNEKNRLIITLEAVPKVEFIDQKENEGIGIIKEILDNAPQAIFIEDESGVILEVNNAACSLHGLSRDEMIGRVITELSPDDFRKEITQKHQLLSEHDGVKFKSVAYPGHGVPKPIEIHVNRINYMGKKALLFIITDLSEQIERKKELDEYKIKADESDRLKSSFLSNLSHEVRTPMNSIMGFAELLAEPEINENERKEFIQLIRQSGKELLNQINSMIDFAKIEAGLIHLKTDICNLEILFHHLHDYAHDILKNNDKLKLFFDLPRDLIKNSIASDRHRLKQILEILLSNSLKYTDEGVIEVGVKIKAPQLYEFYVRDSGLGIPEDKHRQIFENFRQGNDGNSREYSGMGIGLSIASRLIQFMGGHQWVISEPGKGSEFRFVIPDLLYPQGSPFMQVSCGPTTMLKKVMIIAPTEELFLDLCNDSKPFNYQILWAQNALEIKAMLLSNNIRFILIDLDHLPFWQELLPRIKSIENKVQMIAITDHLDYKRRERLKSMGFHDAVKTPINIPILLSLLEKNELSAIYSLTSSINQN